VQGHNTLRRLENVIMGEKRFLVVIVGGNGPSCEAPFSESYIFHEWFDESFQGSFAVQTADCSKNQMTITPFTNGQITGGVTTITLDETVSDPLATCDHLKPTRFSSCFQLTNVEASVVNNTVMIMLADMGITYNDYDYVSLCLPFCVIVDGTTNWAVSAS